MASTATDAWEWIRERKDARRKEREVDVVTLHPDHFVSLEELQRVCYPTLGEGELMNREHFELHWKTFPEGQHVAVERGTGKVVGMNSGLFVDFDLRHPQHTFQDVTSRLTLARHDPEGEYYYGADISVHPEFRRRGIGSDLYNARKDVARRFNKRGVIAGGLLPGYAEHREEMSIQSYVDKVLEGELRDPTLSFQLRNGFQVRGLLENYLEDTASSNWATLLYWQNPEFQPEEE